MTSKLLFIYDGECPFCNHFAELLELKSGLPGLEVKNAREKIPEIPKGYDMDVKGAILIKNGEILNGASAINWVCSHINNPSGPLLRILIATFSSSQRTNFLFPILIFARRIALLFKGVPRKLLLNI